MKYWSFDSAFVDFGFESALLINFRFEFLLCWDLSLMDWEVLFRLGGVHDDFGAFLVDFRVEGVGLFELIFFEECFLFLGVFYASLFPLEHFFVEFIVGSGVLLRGLLVFEKLFHKLFVFFLFFLSFLFLIQFKFLILQFQNLLVSILERLMTTHLLDELEWFFVNLWMELELLLLSLFEFLFFSLNFPFSVFLVLFESTQQ